MKLYFSGRELNQTAIANHAAYASAEPFPHIIFDNLIPEEALDLVLEEFPSADSAVWKEYENYHEKKLETQGEEKIGAFTAHLLYQFNSAPFLRFLEVLTGIDDLIPDPYFYGGGLHQIPKGGKLGVHADFSKHGKFPLERRLNVLVYLNKGWREEFGGQLELWNRDMSQCVKKILPTYNRMVIFNITDWGFHGHPDPMTCPDGMTRKSLALYYYTVGRPEGETMEGKASTLFMQRPNEAVPEGTVFARDGSFDGVKKSAVPNSKKEHVTAIKLKWAIKKVMPPILIDLVNLVRNPRAGL